MELVLPAANREISLVSLSTTLATNALVEGQGSLKVTVGSSRVGHRTLSIEVD